MEAGSRLPGRPELPPAAVDLAAIERRMFEKLYTFGGDKDASASRAASDTSSAKLLASMSSRLTTLEAAQRSLRAELVEKEREILRLKALLAAAPESATEAPPQPESVLDSENDVSALRSELAEIKAFLSDYGLEWVGGGGSGSRECAASFDADQLDLPVFLLRLRQLNTVAGEGKSHVLREGRNAKLVPVSSVPLVVYRDGLVLRGGPFRSYATDASCAAFVEDVLDGFFPFELKAEFPDGTAFAIVDKSDVTFSRDKAGSAATDTAIGTQPSFQAFTGAGCSVAGESSSTSSVAVTGASAVSSAAPPPLSRALSVLSSVGAPEVALLSAEDLLGALPGVRIRDGRVIDVRASMARLLQPPPAAPLVVHSQMLADARHGTASPPATASIQIKLPGGAAKSLVVKLATAETVGALRALVDRQRELLPAIPAAYELFCAYPPRVLVDNAQTVAEAGLVPNATLFVRSPPASASAASPSSS